MARMTRITLGWPQPKPILRCLPSVLSVLSVVRFSGASLTLPGGVTTTDGTDDTDNDGRNRAAAKRLCCHIPRGRPLRFTAWFGDVGNHREHRVHRGPRHRLKRVTPLSATRRRNSGAVRSCSANPWTGHSSSAGSSRPGPTMRFPSIAHPITLSVNGSRSLLLGALCVLCGS